MLLTWNALIMLYSYYPVFFIIIFVVIFMFLGWIVHLCYKKFFRFNKKNVYNNLPFERCPGCEVNRGCYDCDDI